MKSALHKNHLHLHTAPSTRLRLSRTDKRRRPQHIRNRPRHQTPTGDHAHRETQDPEQVAAVPRLRVLLAVAQLDGHLRLLPRAAVDDVQDLRAREVGRRALHLRAVVALVHGGVLALGLGFLLLAVVAGGGGVEGEGDGCDECCVMGRES